MHRRTGQGGREGSRPPWILETSKIRADGMGNSGIQGTEFFWMKVLPIWICKFKLINCKKIAPKMHQNSPFELKNRKIWGHPLSTPYPSQSLWRLDPRAYGARPKIRANLVLPPKWTMTGTPMVWWFATTAFVAAYYRVSTYTVNIILQILRSSCSKVRLYITALRHILQTWQFIVHGIVLHEAVLIFVN